MKQILHLAFSLAAIGTAHAAEAQVAGAGQFQGQPYAYGRPMQVAGLNAPAPFTLADETPTSADGTLDEARAKDSRRGVSWFYVDATGGFEHVGLRAFNPKSSSLGADVLETVQSGGSAGGGIGARLVYLTVGGEGRVGIFSAWKLARAGGALGLHLPFGIVEPTFSLGGGYVTLFGARDAVAQLMSVHGGYGRAAAGLDVYPVSKLSLGAETSVDIMTLKRPAVSAVSLQGLPAGTISDAQSATLMSDGSSIGATFALTAVVGLHI